MPQFGSWEAADLRASATHPLAAIHHRQHPPGLRDDRRGFVQSFRLGVGEAQCLVWVNSRVTL
jgi:hypothetical protein